MEEKFTYKINFVKGEYKGAISQFYNLSESYNRPRTRFKGKNMNDSTLCCK